MNAYLRTTLAQRRGRGREGGLLERRGEYVCEITEGWFRFVLRGGVGWWKGERSRSDDRSKVTIRSQLRTSVYFSHNFCDWN
jgi:hypothetical protein